MHRQGRQVSAHLRSPHNSLPVRRYGMLYVMTLAHPCEHALPRQSPVIFHIESYFHSFHPDHCKQKAFDFHIIMPESKSIIQYQNNKFFTLKKSLLRIPAARIHSVREKIRTPGLLIRSQTLYPAELRAQIISRTSHLCSVLEILYISFSKNASPFFNFFYLFFLQA
ncbi:unknown [Roseburia sp. CAG:380]|nr:unknown [Roseburia sp. CAG:380]